MRRFAILLPLLIGLLPATAPASTGGTAEAGVPVPSIAAPTELSPFGDGWQVRGSGALRFFGFKAYDAHLWTTTPAQPFSYQRPFALDIRYDMSIKGEDIVNTSLIELSRITPATPEQLESWTALMKSVFVDVRAGDRLTGIHLPGRGVRFFLNGRLRGESPDHAFSVAFFNIWLDPQTKRPELRASLLGQAGN